MKEPTDKKPTLPTYHVTFNSGPWYPYPTYPFLPPSPAYDPMYPGAQPPNPGYGPFSDWLEKEKEAKEREAFVKRMQEIIDEWTDKMREKNSELDKITIDKIAEKTDPKEKDTDKSDSEDKTMIGVSAKYELIETSSLGRYRIKALRDFGDVKKGDLGGTVSGNRNLSHHGESWIYPNAMALDESYVKDNGTLKDNVIIRGNAEISGDGVLEDNVFAADNVHVSGNAVVSGSIKLIEFCTIDGNAKVNGSGWIMGHAVVTEDGYVNTHGVITDSVLINGKATVKTDLTIGGNVKLGGNCKIDNDVSISGDWEIGDYVVVINCTLTGTGRLSGTQRAEGLRMS